MLPYMTKAKRNCRWKNNNSVSNNGIINNKLQLLESSTTLLIMGGGSHFDTLPEEVLRSILSFMDVPSIGAISTTHKPTNKNLSSLASDEDTWYLLAQRRFGIGCNHKRRSWRKKKNVVLVKRGSSSSLSSEASSTTTVGGGGGTRRRPQTYGGATWKDAFRLLSLAMRIPETSLTSGSAAKSGGPVFASPSNRWRSSSKRSSSSTDNACNYLGIWCMLNHAENCQTKLCSNDAANSRRRRLCLPYRTDMRYLELKLCLQNTKSGYQTICIPSIDMIRIATLEEADYFSAWGWDKCDYDYPLTFNMIKHGPWAPKLLLRQCVDNHRSCDVEHELNVKDAIVLRPFEVVVLSIHIACSFDMVYETDVLATMSSIRIPVTSYDPLSSNNHLGAQQPNHGVASARFLEEDALWEYYSQLPGGCVSLIDRSRLVPM
jgi:hypothetical protein